MRFMMRALLVIAAMAMVCVGAISASTPGADVRLTHDALDPGYVSAYTLATGTAYTDATLQECSRCSRSAERARGRDRSAGPGGDSRGLERLLRRLQPNGYERTGPVAVGPIWLGYYRSEDGGAQLHEFACSRLSGRHRRRTRAARAGIRTASAGDPVIAWDSAGPRVLRVRELGRSCRHAEDLRRRVGRAVSYPATGPTRGRIPTASSSRARRWSRSGTSAPNLLGKFNDKTTIEADHNSDGRCDNNVYFSWSRFTGKCGGVGIYFVRSTDHGETFSQSNEVSQTIHDVQFPDIAITGNGDVYLFFRSFASGRGHEGDEIYFVKSTDCGATFTQPTVLTSFIRSDAKDESDPEAVPAQSRPDDPLFGEGEEAPIRAPRATAAIRRPLRVGLHVLPSRHAGASDCRPVRSGASVHLRRLRRDEAGHREHAHRDDLRHDDPRERRPGADLLHPLRRCDAAPIRRQP